MNEKVERIAATSKVSVVKPVGYLDSLTDRTKPKKKRLSKSPQDKDVNKETTCILVDNHIDCSV